MITPPNYNPPTQLRSLRHRLIRMLHPKLPKGTFGVIWRAIMDKTQRAKEGPSRLIQEADFTADVKANLDP